MKPSAEFYRHVLDQLFDGLFFVDLERRITYWNKGAEPKNCAAWWNTIP